MSESQSIPDSFHPAVRRWFERAAGRPTPPQELGWPVIASGRSCLIFAPTGSGKTLAAFLAGIDHLVRAGLAGEKQKGVYLLYISPLKALNYDIERNLRVPLEGIAAELRAGGIEPPEITVGVRTGDTPSKERARMARRPPQILITTPESLNLILCSQARTMLREVRQVVVDEIHALAPNKRGAFLSVLLERAEEIAKQSPVRIGLSATQRPLEETARFLGGYGPDGSQRAVTIVDASMRRDIEVSVSSAVPDFYGLKQGELWPHIEASLLGEIQSHRSTIVFANNRRTVERLTLNLNEQAGSRIAEPHHGSISPARRRQTEERLKRGELRAAVATSTLELGIDMGAVDLVCQVQSPKAVSSALQRVGRAGHLFSQTSRGKILCTSVADLLESAVIAKDMLEAKVEQIRAVANPLDVLAQQIAAMTVHGPVRVDSIYDTVRRSACFVNLPKEAFLRTVEMMAGRLGKGFDARVSLDRVNGMLLPLPGTLRTVVSSGGVIPDTGQFPVYLAGTRLSIGELDEEFVWEAREGEAFRLGTSLWRIESIEADRIFVHPTAGVPAKAPFWRGEMVWRSPGLGRDIGEFLEGAERHRAAGDLEEWIRGELPVTREAARNLAGMVDRQMSHGALPTRRRMVVERFSDALGEGRLAVITPFGGRVHQALRIAIVEMLREVTGAAPESTASDDGVLVRLPEDIPDTAGLLRRLTPERFREVLDRGLLQSPLFGLRFRQNAARALLLPGARPGKRNPLWLQRLKAKDLLQVARATPGFPIVAETARECRQDYLDCDTTAAILAEVQAGTMEVAESSSPAPSPFAAALEFSFVGEFMYVWDRPTGEAARDAARADSDLGALLEAGERGIDAEAVARLRDEARHTAEHTRARTPAELAEVMRRLGDVTTAEAAAASADRATSMLDDLAARGVAARVALGGEERWVLAEEASQWTSAAANPDAHEDFWRERAGDFIACNPGSSPESFALRYGLETGMAERAYGEMEARGEAVRAAGGWISSGMLEAARRITLAIRRRESSPVSTAAFQSFVFDWQNRSPGRRLEGPDALCGVVEKLAGFAAPSAVWEAEVFARRINAYVPSMLDSALASGQIVWRGIPGTGRPGHVAFLPRALSGALPGAGCDDDVLSPLEAEILTLLHERGASFLVDLGVASGRDTRLLEEALLGLVWRGQVTQDSFGALRAAKGARTAAVRDAAARTHGSPRQRYQQLKRLRPPLSPGALSRWSALPTAGPEPPDEEATELMARILLDRYGVVTRDIARRDSFDIGWGSLYRVLERMEMAGEILRGWFVRASGGAQFALHEAADALRRFEKQGGDGPPLSVNSCDPAIVTEGPWTRRPTNTIVFVRGQAALLLEGGAKRLTPLAGESEAIAGMDALPDVLDSPWPMRPLRRIEVQFWGEREITGTAVEAELRSRGFRRTPKGLVLS